MTDTRSKTAQIKVNIFIAFFPIIIIIFLQHSKRKQKQSVPLKSASNPPSVNLNITEIVGAVLKSLKMVLKSARQLFLGVFTQ